MAVSSLELALETDILPPPPAAPVADAPLQLGRLTLVPDLSGALWLPDEATLVVADLHLEKGSSYARRGVALPPYDTCTTLAQLASVITRRQPRRVIALGDTWHDMDAYERLCAADLAALNALRTGRDWLWITGNHDPLPSLVGGNFADRTEIAGVRLVHEPTLAPGHEIAGHLHPCASVRLRGRRLRRRCFAASSQRVVMPAMGAYTGGLSLNDPVFRPLFPQSMAAHMLGDTRVFAVNSRLLCPM